MSNGKKTEQERMAVLEAENASLKADVAQLTQQVQYLLEQARLGKHRQFGVSTEKSEYDQVNLFNEAEVFAKPIAAESELCKVEMHYRQKRRELPSKLPEDLPVEVVEHRLADDAQGCPACNAHLHVMGKKVVRRELKLIPAKATIMEHVQVTYSCRCCEKNAISVPVVKAPMPQPLIKSSFASPEAIAHIMTQKSVIGVPLYRQEQDWKRQGILLSQQTMSNWLIRAMEDLLEPVHDALKSRLLTHQVLHADETTLQVLRDLGKSAQSKSYTR